MSSHYDLSCFLRIIREKTLEEGKLPLRNEFMRKYGEGLSNPVCIRHPNGTEWKVHWTKHDDGVYFDNGWTEFAKYYSLQKGNILVFKYEGDSKFHVLMIFDSRSTFKIDHPLIDLDQDQEDDSVETNDESPLLHREKPKSPTPPSQPHKKRKTQALLGGGKLNTGRQSESEADTSKRHKSSKRDKVFCPENPLSFRVKLCPTYVDQSQLAIPTHFSMEHLYMKEGNAHLIIGERTWTVTYKFIVTNKRSIFTSGWLSFARDNNLKVDDVCEFEMTKFDGNTVSYKVSILQADEEPFSQVHDTGVKRCKTSEHAQNLNSGHSMKQDNGRRGSSTSKNTPKHGGATESNSETTTFKVSLTRSYVHMKANLHVPYKFAKENFNLEKREGDVTLKLQNGKSWPVKYLFRSSGMIKNVEFVRGWREFLVENELSVDDTCVFKLTKKNGDDIVLEVSIIHHLN